MYPILYIFGQSVPTYSLFAIMGMAVSMLLLMKLLFKRLIFRKYMPLCLISTAGLLVGAKVFAFLSQLLMTYCTTGIWNWKDSFLHSGIVYFGGLLGYITMLKILCQFRERSWHEISNAVAVAIPLFHAFGRIGCFFGGCCYGKEIESPIAIPYRIVMEDGIWINRIPIQLIEALFELILFIILLVLYQRKLRYGNVRDGKLLLYYLFYYSIWRFVIEFWRGDTQRGVFYGISFSQLISIAILFVCIIKFAKIYRRKII